MAEKLTYQLAEARADCEAGTKEIDKLNTQLADAVELEATTSAKVKAASVELEELQRTEASLRVSLATSINEAASAYSRLSKQSEDLEHAQDKMVVMEAGAAASEQVCARTRHVLDLPTTRLYKHGAPCTCTRANSVKPTKFHTKVKSERRMTNNIGNQETFEGEHAELIYPACRRDRARDRQGHRQTIFFEDGAPRGKAQRARPNEQVVGRDLGPLAERPCGHESRGGRFREPTRHGEG